ncbi:MAG: oligosaccharide flippase family protein [Acidimicrobiales bacterium]
MTYNLAGQVGVMIISLLAVHAIYRRLGASSFGVITISLVWSTTLVSAFELGFASVVVRAVAAGRTDDGEDPTGLLRSAASIYWFLAFAAALLVYLVLPAVFPLLFRSVSPSVTEALTASRILLIGGLFAIPRAFYQAVLRGAERMGGINIINVASQAGQQFGTYFLAIAGAKLITLAWWVVAWFAISTFLSLVTARRVVPTGSLRPGWDPVSVRRHRSFAASMAVVSATSVVQVQGDESAVSWTLPVQVAGYYATGAVLLGKAQSLVSAAAEASLPAVTRSHLDTRQSLVVRYRKLHDLICFGSLPLYAGITFAAGPVFTRLFSPAAARSVEVPVMLLAFGYFTNSTVSALYITALATGRAGIVARTNLIVTGVVFPLVVIFAHFFGMVGASLAWLMYGAMIYLLMVPRLVRSCLGSTLWTWLRFNARFVPSLFVFALGWVCLQNLGPDRILVVAYCLAPTLALHLGLSFIFVGPELKSTVLATWTGITSRAPKAAP